MNVKDYTYKNIDNKQIKLSFIEPINKVYEKAPVYFIIPGGGWHMETRESMIEFSEDSVVALGEKGFATVSIDYRVTSDNVTNMYDIIQDCFDALIYVCENSDNFHIDPNRIVISGHSAGGHLALMLAYANPMIFTDKEKNFTVKAVAPMSAPTILYDKTTHNLENDILKTLKGLDFEKASREISPYEYVASDCPPTLLIAGTKDPLVYSSSSEKLYDKLCENKVDCVLKLSINGGHCFEEIEKGCNPQLKVSEIQKIICDFALKNI